MPIPVYKCLYVCVSVVGRVSVAGALCGWTGRQHPASKLTASIQRGGEIREYREGEMQQSDGEQRENDSQNTMNTFSNSQVVNGVSVCLFFMCMYHQYLMQKINFFKTQDLL